LERLARAEEKKVLADRAYRTSARTLRRLSKAQLCMRCPEPKLALGTSFAMRNIGFALQRRMARQFGGDAAKMRAGLCRKDRQPAEREARANACP